MNVTFEAAQGSSLLPDTMNVAEYEWETSENIVDIPEGIDGYYFTWTAYASGKLTIDVSNGKAGWAYQIQNLTPRAIGEWHYSYDVPTVNSETIYVNEGETIAVVVNTCGETLDDVTPAGEVYFYATFEKSTGTEENPLVPEWVWNEAGTEATATITVPAGTSIFVAFTDTDLMLSINDGEPEAITGNDRMPQVVELTGAEEGETVYTLKLTYPAGSRENPAEIVMGNNVAIVPDTGAGYNYTFTAEERGQFTFTMTSESNWVYVMNVIRGFDEEWGYPIYEYGEAMMASYGDPVEMVVDLEAGQTIELMVATEDYTAGDITFTAEFAPALGTASNPEQLMLDGVDDYFGNYVAPGQSYHYVVRGVGGMMLYAAASCKGMTVAVDGEVYTFGDDFLEIQIPGMVGNPRAITTITFTNNTDEEQGYDFIFEYPYGSEMNPAEMVIGKNTIKLAANDMDGHSFLFYPNGMGYLTLTMNTSSNWTYVANIVEWDDEMQTFVPVQYGDTQLSSDKNAKKSQTFELEGGQMVMMTVGTENRKAGTITFTAAFANKMIDMLAGKTTTLTFTDPKTGKAVAASNVNWKIINVNDANGNEVEGLRDENDDVVAETVAKYASINNGKLTTVAHEKWHNVVVLGELKSDPSVTNSFYVSVWPATTSIKLNQVKGMYWSNGYWTEDDTYEEGGYWTEDDTCEDGDWQYAWDEILKEDVTEITIVANGDGDAWLEAVIGPEEAMKDMVWKSSNPKLVDAGTRHEFDEETQTQHLYVAVYANGYNEKTNKWTTGTATLTGTAADGSGKKVTLKVKVVVDPQQVEITAKNDQHALGSNKSMTLTAKLNTWYNQDPTNKTVTWSMQMSDGEPQWVADPNGYDRKWIPDENGEESILVEGRIWIEDESYDEGGYYDWGSYWQNGYYEYGTWVTTWIDDVPASVATLTQKGVLKAAAGLDQAYQIRVIATATKTDGTPITGEYDVSLMPVANKIDIENVPTTYDVNDGNGVYPYAYSYLEYTNEDGETYTDFHCDNVVWTVSNTKIAKIVEGHWDDAQQEWRETELVFTGVTGKVTLTATATDGSNLKKSVTINVVKAPNLIDRSIYEAKIAAGKPLTIKATPYVEKWDELGNMTKDTAVTDKTILWSVDVVEVQEFEDEWGDTYEDWVPVANTIDAKISGGKLTTNAQKVTEPVTLKVTAKAKLAFYDSYFGEFNPPAEATCYVTVYPATTNVTLHRFGKAVTNTTMNLDKDSYAVLHAEGSPADAYTWKTSNAKIATIENNADGSITVRPTGKLGTVTITATAVDGTNKSAKVNLKILEKIDTLKIAEVGVAATKSVNLNNFLTINPSNATMKQVKWSWAYEWAAEDYKALGITLNANGTLSAAKVKNLEYPIDVEVRAVAADGLGAQQYATVTIYPATTKVELVDEYGPIAKTGETVSHKLGQWQMSAVGYATINKESVPGVVADTYKWTTTNAKIATVDQNGLVTFTGVVGSVTIKATATDGTNKSAQTTIKVVKFVEDISLSVDYVPTLAKGKTLALPKVVAIAPADATTKTLKWEIASEKQWNPETEEFDIDVPGAAKLDAKGNLKVNDIKDIVEVVIKVTATDTNTVSYMFPVYLAPYAVKGIQILDQNKEVNLTRTTYTTSNGSAKLYPVATNEPDEMCASDFTWTVNNKNFEVVWDGVYAVVQPVEGAANPFGTVKVTVKATDGSNVSNYTTIEFEPAT